MVSKVTIICTFAIMVQAISGQNCYKASSSKAINSGIYSSIGSSSLSSSGSCQSITISNSGGEFLISATGPVSPSGIAVATDLGLSGDLDLSGKLPYLSAVEFQGQFDTKGSAPVSYGCGDCVAITQEIGNPSGSYANINSGSSKINSYGCGKLY